MAQGKPSKSLQVILGETWTSVPLFIIIYSIVVQTDGQIIIASFEPNADSMDRNI